MEYEYPQLSLLIITSVRNQQNSTKVLSYYSMLMYSSQACFKHSNFFTVNDGEAMREHHPPRMHLLRGYTEVNPAAGTEIQLRAF